MSICTCMYLYGSASQAMARLRTPSHIVDDATAQFDVTPPLMVVMLTPSCPPLRQKRVWVNGSRIHLLCVCRTQVSRLRLLCRRHGKKASGGEEGKSWNMSTCWWILLPLRRMMSWNLSQEDRGSYSWCGRKHVLCVSCSSARALQHRGRKEAHAGQSDTARPSTAVPIPELRVAKPKPGPLEVLDTDTSDEPDGSDLPPENTVLDLTVPRTALVSCANCRACGASGSMPRSRVLLYLTRVARLRGRVTWLLLSWMVSWRCFLCLFSRESGGRPAVLFKVRRWSTTLHRNSIYVGCTLSNRVGQTLVDALPPHTRRHRHRDRHTHTPTHTHHVRTVCRQDAPAF